MPTQPKLSFLMIDDDPNAIEETSQALEQHPYHCTTNTTEALAHYRRHQPDIVLLDICADGSGFEALEHILEFDPNAFVVILTTSRSDKDVQTTLQAGAAGYILKPLKPHHVDECITEYHHFKNKRTRKETETALERP